MTTAILQTPLEVILFFTSLAAYGVRPESFQIISETLKADQSVRESDNYDEARLSPESLQQLYLSLLKDEVRNQNEKKRSASPVGQENGSPGPRKRKISSPQLRSLTEAQGHEHLVPVLVNKLYARYREQAIASIINEEAQYRSLEADIAALEKHEDKEQINGIEATREARASSIQLLLRSNEEETDRDTGSASHPQTDHVSSVDTSTVNIHGQGARLSALPSPEAAPLAGTSSSKPSRQPESGGAPGRPPSSGFGQHPYSPHDIYGRRPSEGHLPTIPLLPGQPPGSEYGMHTPAPIIAPSTASPQQTQSPGLPMEGLSQSPIILPPPPGMIRPAGSPTMSMQTPQYRPGPSLPSPVQSQRQIPSPHTIPRPDGYQQRGLPYQDQRSPYSPQYPPYGQTPESYHASLQQMPQYVPNGFAYQHAQIPANPLVGQVPRHYSQYGATPVQGGLSQTPQQLYSHQSRSPVQAIPPHSSVRKRLSTLPSLDTSASSTKWKSAGRAKDRSPIQPMVSPLETDFAALAPELEDNFIKEPSRTTGESVSSRATLADVDETPSRPSRIRGRGGRKGPTSRNVTRAGSATASARTRSQSVVSHTEEAPPRKQPPARKVKPEPGTPAAEEQAASFQASGTVTPLPLAARRHRDTFRSIESPTTIRPGTKRKRANTLEVGSPSSTGPTTPCLPTAPTRPGHILGVRNMPRIASMIINDVTTHKLASMFQKPISEREAPGYRDLVFWPQDLKTIRGQLQAGARAIAAADAAAQESGGCGEVAIPAVSTAVGAKAGGTVWLERSADVMPPRAIVNSGQLEKEICRIFANAVMFNPDPKRGVGPAFRTRARRMEALRRGKDMLRNTEEEAVVEDDFESGVINDAREMFHDVEKQLAGWRAAERTTVGDGGVGYDGAKDEDMVGAEVKDGGDDDEAAPPLEAEEGRSGRRRKP